MQIYGIQTPAVPRRRLGHVCGLRSIAKAYDTWNTSRPRNREGYAEHYCVRLNPVIEARKNSSRPCPPQHPGCRRIMKYRQAPGAWVATLTARDP